MLWLLEAFFHHSELKVETGTLSFFIYVNCYIQTDGQDKTELSIEAFT